MNTYLKKIIIAGLLLGVCIPPLISFAATVGRPVSNTGLVGWWSFDEGSGTIAHDLSGNRNNGTFVGGPVWVNGKKGKALDFDGIDDYVTTTINRSSYAAITVSAWYKFEGSISDTYNALISSQGGDFFVGKNTGNSNIGVQEGGYNGSIAAGTNAWDGNWHQITYTFSGGTGTVYLDGRNVGSGAFAGGTGLIWIGQENEVGGYDFNGKIDDVRVYSRALSPTEVSSLYGSTQATHVTATKTGLVGYWSFNEGVGTVIHDQSGNSKNGVFTNGSTWTDGRFGKAGSFDGVNDHIVVSGITSVPVNGPATISGWFYATTTAVARGSSLFLFEDLYQHPVNNMLYLTNGADFFSVAAPLTTNTWHHVVLTYNGTHETSILYLDGVRYNVVIQTAGQNHLNMNPFYIGSDGGGGGGTYGSKIDDFRIYNRVLTQDEVLALYKSKEIVINQSQNNKLTNGLVGYWTFNGQDTLTTIADVSGQSNHGYFIGGATSTAKVVGKVGQALNFNGSTDYMRVTSPYYTFGTEITVATWAKFDNWNYVLSQAEFNVDAMGTNVWLWHASNGGFIWYVNDNETWRNVTLSTLSTGKWYHLATVADTTSTRIYVDGVLTASGPGISSSIKNVPTSEIGTNDIRYGGVGRPPHDGVLDEVRVYNRAISAAEIKQLYLMGK